MVQKAEKYFIFSWREILVIFLLAIISIGFFFTLGLHYGKKITKQSVAQHEAAGEGHDQSGKLEPGLESLPNRETLEQASHHALVATEDSIKTATQEALDESGVKMEAPKQVDLPDHKVSETPAKVAEHKKSDEHKPIEKESAHNKKSFAIQLGSFPNKTEAGSRVKFFSKRGVHAEIKSAVVHGVIRYRVVLGGFSTKKEADAKANDLKQKKKIDGFVIIKNES